MAARRKKLPAPTDPQTAPETAPLLTAVPTMGIAGTTAEERAQPTAGSEAAPRVWHPDPFPLMTLALGTDTNGPAMKLFRSNKLNQMAIRFDEKPGAEHRERLRAEGWRWREAEGVWTKQLDRERRAAGQLGAERLFTEIAEAIRAERGLTGRTGVGG